MKQQKLTDKEQKMYSVIKRYIARTGHAPSLTDCALELELTAKGASVRFEGLERKGFATRDEKFHRSIRLLK